LSNLSFLKFQVKPINYEQLIKSSAVIFDFGISQGSGWETL